MKRRCGKKERRDRNQCRTGSSIHGVRRKKKTTLSSYFHGVK
jgi:hypothetical protein